MRARLRLALAVVRPAVVTLVVLSAVAGVAQGGGAVGLGRLGLLAVAVVGSLACAVAVNDLSDEAIDRVNLGHDPGRLLVAGSHRRQLAAVAAVAAGLALAAAGLLGLRAALLVLGALALAAAYSLRPVRLADRGVVAPLLLPLGYVAVPYLLGVLAARDHLVAGDLALLGGLYAGFVGRIVLKDLRDVRGDALFGKRTFLVRHGRVATCRLSAAGWLVGLAVLPAIRGATPVLVASWVVLTGLALVLLRGLAAAGGARRDEAIVGGLALCGRGVVVLVVAHLTLVDAGWAPAGAASVLVAVAATTVGQVLSMVRHGPRSGLVLDPAVAGAAGSAGARVTAPG